MSLSTILGPKFADYEFPVERQEREAKELKWKQEQAAKAKVKTSKPKRR